MSARAVAFALVLVSVATQAQLVDPPPGDRWWRDRALLPALDLEPATRQALERIHAEASAELERLAAEQTAAEAALARRIHDPAGTGSAPIEPVLERVIVARVAVERRHARMLLDLRAALGPGGFAALQRLQATVGPEATRGQPPRAPGGPGPQAPRLGLPPSGPGSPGRPPEAGPGARPGSPAGPPLPGRLSLPLPPGAWWRDPDRQRQLALGARQVGDLEAAFAARRDALHERSAALEGAEARMRQLLAPGDLDLAPATAAATAVAEARGDLDRLFLELQWSQWLVLTDEQRLRLTYAR